MSTDIVTNQIANDVMKSASVAKTSSSAQADAQSSPVAEQGKTLPPEAEKVSQEELELAVVDLNNHMQDVQRDLLFSVDESGGRTVVQVLNSTTAEVIRQMPTEEALRISQRIKEQTGDLSGLFIKASA